MADTTAETAAPNSLGLDFEQLSLKVTPDQTPAASAAEETTESPANPDAETGNAPESEPKTEEEDAPAQQQTSSPETAKPEVKEKKKPYVNSERVKTGGTQRDKLSEEELAERMARIREQNEKIKQRRVDVQADEEAFKKTQEAERAKLAKTKKVQETIDRTREQNARRKLEKVQNREWDSGKNPRDWKQPRKPGEESNGDNPAPQASIGIRGAMRGGRGRGRGGFSRGSAPAPAPAPAAAAEESEKNEKVTKEAPAVVPPAEPAPASEPVAS